MQNKITTAKAQASKTKNKRLTFAEALAIAQKPRDEIKIVIEGKTKIVPRLTYIKAKTAQMIQFGYDGLTETDVTKQLDLILAGKKLGDEGFTVIGGFMQGEIVREGKANQ